MSHLDTIDGHGVRFFRYSSLIIRINVLFIIFMEDIQFILPQCENQTPCRCTLDLNCKYYAIE